MITSLTEGPTRILVEERPTENAGSKASVAIDSATRVWSVGGQVTDKISASRLRVGSKVRVWFDGPVAMSYPVQGKASDVALEGAP